MDPAVRSLIAALHAAPRPYALALTGGGVAAAGWLLSVPGGARTVLEVAVPYGEQALAEYLGRRPEAFCSAATARAMAARAWARARWLAPGGPVAGAACTASLRSDRPKRGEHRCHVAAHSDRGTLTHSLTLTKEARTRAEEEEVVDRVLLNVLAEALGVADHVPVGLLPGEEVVAEADAPADPLSAFLAGRRAGVCVEPDGRARADAPPPKFVLCGSFNPLHQGHLALAGVAARLAGGPGAFELTAVNADKPALPEGEVRRRLAQFAWRAPLWLTRAPTFPEKAALFPGAVFVVGADTVARVVQPRFYGDSGEAMAAALGQLRARGCSFLVAGRLGADGTFLELGGLEVPAAHADLFRAVPAGEFRVDVSSTQLRDGEGLS